MTRTDPPGLDLDRLRAYLDARRPGLVAGELSADVVEGGRSNLTYVVGDGSSRWVVRRPPLGHVLPTAHDMGREFRVISGLLGRQSAEDADQKLVEVNNHPGNRVGLVPIQNAVRYFLKGLHDFRS